MSRQLLLSLFPIVSCLAIGALGTGCEERREPQGIERIGHEIDDAVEDVEDSAEDLGENVDEAFER
jgi:hypothetical protein